jgi:hypothetical protein
LSSGLAELIKSKILKLDTGLWGCTDCSYRTHHKTTLNRKSTVQIYRIQTRVNFLLSTGRSSANTYSFIEINNLLTKENYLAFIVSMSNPFLPLFWSCIKLGALRYPILALLTSTFYIFVEFPSYRPLKRFPEHILCEGWWTLDTRH